MAQVHLVVDGSNIATEGRSLPSLPQLLGAVDAISSEREWAAVTVIVDATFGHRIDESERDEYEAALESGRLITPPAGVIGRGDAFILEVADRAQAVVLSNDSFQEFHGTFLWLFEEGRLLGGKHVPGVGWIFLPRSPVRGPTSRRAVSDAKRRKRGAQAEDAAAKTAPAPKAPADRSSGRGRKKAATKAKAAVAEEPRVKRAGKEPEPYNSPLPFIEFVSAHPVGSVISAVVEQFSSHGAYVVCEDTRCYISLRTISEPPPRSARHVFTVGETRDFVVRAVDTPRRGIDLELPAGVVLTPREPDDLDVPVADEPPAVEEAGGRSRRGRRRSGSDSRSSDQGATAGVDPATTAPTPVAPVSRSEPPRPVAPVPATTSQADGSARKLSVSQRRKLRAAEEATAREAEQAAARAAAGATAADADAPKGEKKAPAKKAAVEKAAPAKKAAVKKAAPAKKAAAKKAAAAAKSAPVVEKATAKRVPAKKAAVKKAAPAKRVPAKKAAPATKAVAPAKKAAVKKAAPAKRVPAKKAAPATKAVAPAKKAAVKKAAPAKKAAAKKAAAKKA